MLSPPLSPGLTWNVLEAAPPPSIAWHLLCGHECTSLCWGCGGGERAPARAGFAVAAGTFLVGSAVHQGIREASGSSLGRRRRKELVRREPVQPCTASGGSGVGLLPALVRFGSQSNLGC